MKALVRVLLTRSGIAAAAGLFTLSVGVIAQQPATPQAPAAAPAAPPAAGPPPNPNAAATAADHKNMMDAARHQGAASRSERQRVGAEPRQLRRGRSPIRIPNLPDPLTLKNGKKVTSADVWWKQRRPEIVEDFDREVLGRVPRTCRRSRGACNRTEQFEVGGRPVVGKELIGAVDNSAYPEITVEIQMTLVTPAERGQGRCR